MRQLFDHFTTGSLADILLSFVQNRNDLAILLNSLLHLPLGFLVNFKLLLPLEFQFDWAIDDYFFLLFHYGHWLVIVIKLSEELVPILDNLMDIFSLLLSLFLGFILYQAEFFPSFLHRVIVIAGQLLSLNLWFLCHHKGFLKQILDHLLIGFSYFASFLRFFLLLFIFPILFLRDSLFGCSLLIRGDGSC